MTIEFQCVHCGAAVRVPSGSEGRSIRCGACGELSAAPQQPRASLSGDLAPVPWEDAAGTLPAGDSERKTFLQPSAAEGPAAWIPDGENTMMRASVRLSHVGYSLLVASCFAIVLQVLPIILWSIQFANDRLDGATFGFNIGSAVAGISISIVVLFGARAMIQGKGQALCWLGAVLSLLPCNCMLFLIPVGIWAVITLRDPDVTAMLAASKKRLP